MRNGFALFEPILIEIEAGSSAMPDVTIDRTVTSGKPFDWAQHYTREYAGHSFLVVAPQHQSAGMPFGEGGVE